jgi:hypothetical protein
MSVPAPVIDPLAQVSPLSTGTPVPFKPTASEVPVEELLVMLSWPVAAPVAAGLKSTVRVRLPLAATVTGKLLEPLTEKDCPVVFSWEICTAADPWFTRVTLVLAV